MQQRKKVWLQAKCWATRATLEVAQVAFLECGSIGIEIDDGQLPDDKWAYGDDRILIKAFFEPRVGLIEEIESYYHKIFSECGLDGQAVEFSEVENIDWQQNFVSSCTAFKIEPNIFIVPSFEIDDFNQASTGDIVIEMDPENAFGTGQHQTTKLCLTRLHKILSSDDKKSREDFWAVDIGTGSGILSILMKKLGVANVLASETDNDALMTAVKNAKKNHVAFDALLVDEEYLYGTERYDLVVANILAPVLNEMASNVVRAVKPGGKIVLSGILVEQAPNVVEKYSELGVKLLIEDRMDDWCALVFGK